MLTLEQMKAHRKLWVEALRSGKYEQGYGQLYRGGKHCCLGVLCAVFGDPEPSGGTLWMRADVKDFVGLSDEEGRMANGRELTHLNDVRRLSFAEIADIIESEPEGLFINPEAA